MGDRIFLDDLDERPFVVLKTDRLLVAWIQTDGLNPFRFRLGDVVRGGDGFFRDLIAAGIHPLGDSPVLPGHPLVFVIAVDPLHQEDGSGDLDGGIVRV